MPWRSGPWGQQWLVRPLSRGSGDPGKSAWGQSLRSTLSILASPFPAHLGEIWAGSDLSVGEVKPALRTHQEGRRDGHFTQGKEQSPREPVSSWNCWQKRVCGDRTRGQERMQAETRRACQGVQTSWHFLKSETSIAASFEGGGMLNSLVL